MTDRVDDYIERQPSPQKEICEKLRSTILNAFPDIREVMKWGVPTYDGSTYYIVALKDHVNIGFSVAGLSTEELKLFGGSGKTMKHLEIRTLNEIDEAHIEQLLHLVWNVSR
ncbi:MAG: DUF1801 domain-containing protein [Euryarchaeota archaeon]